MSVNLDELQEELPDVGAAGQAPSVLYSIDDDLFDLTEKQKELRQIAADFAQKNVVQKDISEAVEKYMIMKKKESQEQNEEASTALIPAANSDEKKYDDEEAEVKEEKTEDKIMKDREIFKGLGKLGLLGIRVKKDYGGQEGSMIDSVIAQEELARADVITALQYNMQDNHCIYPIDRFGTNEQKLNYLPKLCSGELIGVMSLSTSEDKSELKELQAEKQEDYYVLNGVATVERSNADIFIAYALTDHNVCGVTAFIVEKSFEGITFLNDYAEKITFQNCKVPASNLLGEKDKGNDIILNLFNIEKIAFAAQKVGIMQAICDAACEYAHTSNKFDELKDEIVGMYTKLRASESYLYTTVHSYDNGYINSKDCISVNLYCSKNASILAENYKKILGNAESIDSQSIILLTFLKLHEKFACNDKRERNIVNSSLITKEYDHITNHKSFN